MRQITCKAIVNDENKLNITCDGPSPHSKIVFEASIGMLLTTSKIGKISNFNGKIYTSPHIEIKDNKILILVPQYAAERGLTFITDDLEITLNVDVDGNLLAPPIDSRVYQVLSFADSILPEVALEDMVYGMKCKHKPYMIRGIVNYVKQSAKQFVLTSGFILSIS